MKDSGINWIGAIPDNWKIVRNKNVFSYCKSIVGKQSSSTQLLSLTTQGIKKKDINSTEGKLPESFDTYQLVHKDNLVMCLFDLDCSAVFSGLSRFDGMISPAYRILSCKENILPEYADYWFQYIQSGRKFNHYAKNIRYTLSYEDFSTLPILLPNITEQQKISNYLDSRCQSINSIIDTEKGSINQLEEYKKSTITKVIMQGLNFSTPKKKSREGWINLIPQNWKVIKGKQLFRLRNEKGNNKNLQLLSPTQKYGVIPQTLYEQKTGMHPVKLRENIDLSLMKTIHIGDFCISLRSFQGGFEYCQYEGVVSPAYQVFYPQVAIINKYYKYLFKETGFIQKMNSFTLSLRDGKNIAFSDFGNTYLPFPPLAEQQCIANYLEQKCNAIDKLISQKQLIISKLAEYKASLIYEVVTGKKEV